MIQGNKLITHAIYFNPSDYPGRYVGRVWDCSSGPTPIPSPKPFAVADTLEAVRQAVPNSSNVRIGRSNEDDPCIVEVWL